jgi:hypothetical protein
MRRSCARQRDCAALETALNAVAPTPDNVVGFLRPAIRARLDAFVGTVATAGGTACCLRMDIPDLMRALSDNDLGGVLDGALEAAQVVTTCSSRCPGLEQLLDLVSAVRAALPAAAAAGRAAEGLSPRRGR